MLAVLLRDLPALLWRWFRAVLTLQLLLLVPIVLLGLLTLAGSNAHRKPTPAATVRPASSGFSTPPPVEFPEWMSVDNAIKEVRAYRAARDAARRQPTTFPNSYPKQ